MSGWEEAAREAEELQDSHPGWHVRPVRRRNGAGVEAVRDGRSLTGAAEEVRAALARET